VSESELLSSKCTRPEKALNDFEMKVAENIPGHQAQYSSVSSEATYLKSTIPF
jgi:hypothetical protein